MQGATFLPYTSLNLARRVHSSQAQPTCFGHMTEARMANNPGFRPRSPQGGVTKHSTFGGPDHACLGSRDQRPFRWQAVQ